MILKILIISLDMHLILFLNKKILLILINEILLNQMMKKLA